MDSDDNDNDNGPPMVGSALKKPVTYRLVVMVHVWSWHLALTDSAKVSASRLSAHGAIVPHSNEIYRPIYVADGVQASHVAAYIDITPRKKGFETDALAMELGTRPGTIGTIHSVPAYDEDGPFLEIFLSLQPSHFHELRKRRALGRAMPDVLRLEIPAADFSDVPSTNRTTHVFMDKHWEVAAASWSFEDSPAAFSQNGELYPLGHAQQIIAGVSWKYDGPKLRHHQFRMIAGELLASALRRNNAGDSNRNWVKTQWQVRPASPRVSQTFRARGRLCAMQRRRTFSAAASG